ncbi:MAG: methyltransferase family protein [Gammaproteobacteria bacterium]
MPDEHPDHANVVALPPLVYLAFFFLGVGLNYVWPLAPLPSGPRYPLGFALVASGVLLIARAMVQFRQTGTPLEPYKPTTALVTDGVFCWSRNPIYLALSLIYVGIGVIASNGWILILLVPVLVAMRYGVIAREERYLEYKFGEIYRRYKATVRRWL